jgi:hypothetical protein
MECRFESDRTHWGFDGRKAVSEAADEGPIPSAPTSYHGAVERHDP